MLKINLSEERGFSDSITATFSFVRQEFIPFIKVFGVIVLPLIFIDFFVKSFFLRSVFDFNDTPENLLSFSKDMMLNGLAMFVVYMWIQLMVVAYMKVYHEKFRDGVEKPISVGDVWKVMCERIFQRFGVMIVYVLIVIFGFLFLIFPGLYFSIGMAFFLFFMVVRTRSLGDSLADSMTLTKGHWWNTFFYLIVLQIIIGMLAYIFNIPYVFLTIKMVFVGEVSTNYELVFCYLLSSLGQYLAQTVFMIGLGVKFFSMVEQKEHVALLDKIEHLGQESPTKEDEDEGER